MLFLLMEVSSLEYSTTRFECTSATHLPVQEIASGRISVFYNILIASSRYFLIPGIQGSPYWRIIRRLMEARTFRASIETSTLTLIFSLNGFRVCTIACKVTLRLNTGKWPILSKCLTPRAQMLQKLSLRCAKSFLSIKRTA